MVFGLISKLEVLDARWTAAKPSFCYDEDCILTGRLASEEGTLESDYCKSLYADDGAFVFTQRADIESHLPLIFDTLADFGLTMHIGRGDKKGKTEAVFFPAASDLASARAPRKWPKDSHSTLGRPGKRRKCVSCPAKTKSATRQCVRCQRKAAAGTLRDRSNVAPILVADGFVHFVDRFNYLGSTIKDDLSDDVDCDIRIQQAAGAFGALKSRLFEARSASTQAKRIGVSSASSQPVTVRLRELGLVCLHGPAAGSVPPSLCQDYGRIHFGDGTRSARSHWEAGFSCSSPSQAWAS